MHVSLTVPNSLKQLEGYFKVNLIFNCYLMTTWQYGRSAWSNKAISEVREKKNVEEKSSSEER